MTQPTLLVLAAGMGSRYGGLKQVDPIGPHGEVILDYSVYDAIRAGFGRIVFIIRPDIEDVFKSDVTSKFEDRIPVDFVHQTLDDLPGGFSAPEGRQKPWGTAHAMWVARNVIGENFGVINADDFYGTESYRLLAEELRTARDGDKADYSMIGYILGNTLSEHGSVNRGVCETNAQGELIHVEEVVKIEKDPDAETAARYPGPDGQFIPLQCSELVAMNMFGFTPSIFGYIERDMIEFLQTRREEAKSEIYIPSVVNKLIQTGQARMKVIPSQDSWFGVTYPEDKPHVVADVQKLIAQGAYPENLWG